MEIQIDEEFKALIPPLTTVEYAQLEDNIQRDGCRDALMLWKGTGILVDGHNRYEICEREQLDFRTVEIPFESREKAIDWICMNQLGRRNLSPVDATMLRGRMYEGRKKSEGAQTGNDNRKSKQLPQNEGVESTAEIVAKETGVSRATVERAAEFVKAIDKVATVVPDVLAKVRTGETSKADVIAAAKNLETAKQTLADKKPAPVKWDKSVPTSTQPVKKSPTVNAVLMTCFKLRKDKKRRHQLLDIATAAIGAMETQTKFDWLSSALLKLSGEDRNGVYLDVDIKRTVLDYKPEQK